MKAIRLNALKGRAWAACLLTALLFAFAACTEDDEKETMYYAVTFNSQGGSAVPAQTVEEGGLAEEPTAPTRTGYAFTGWYREAECLTAWNFATDVVTADLTLYAGWAEASIDALRELLQQVDAMNPAAYEEESFAAMQEKANAARALVMSPDGASPDDILRALQELSVAISQLVELPFRMAVGIRFEPEIPGSTVYVTPGEWVNITAYGIDANGEDATIRDVSFNYYKDHYWFASGHQAEVTANTLSLYINPEDATPGTYLNIDIRTEDGAQMATATVILRVMDSGDFERLLSQLPLAEEVTFDNYHSVLRTVQQLDAMVLVLPEADQADAQTIINHYYYVLGRFSEWQYSFNGDQYVIYTNDATPLHADYEAEGTFPCGMFTVEEWTVWDEQYDETIYAQLRYKLNGDGTFAREARISVHADGSDALPWQEAGTGTYRLTDDSDDTFGTLLMKLDLP